MVDHLHSWRSLNDRMQDPKLTEAEAWELLEQETKNGARLQFMLRIFGRANKMRTARERNALMKRAAKSK